ncbi:MAG: hypothetical protein M1819_006726 [Sarea resinae]|nr:MAG: hypothetical protein M1819_006726 [Sarea resinae]
MAINYSKWDNLELSDDSDIEVHPNVDKRSFIRAKQTQIHQERLERRHKIDTLKYERIINDGLLVRIDHLLSSLRAHEDSSTTRNPDELVFQSLIESSGDAANDKPPPPPENVHAEALEATPSYSKIMATLVDQVKKEVDASAPENRYHEYIKQIRSHQKKVQDLQKQLLEKLAELEKEEARKITSDNLHTGFDSSFVAKTADNKADGPKAHSVELLNPAAGKAGAAGKPDSLKRSDSAISSGAEADIEEEADEAGHDEDEHIEPTKLGKEFAEIKAGDYRACLQYISEHPKVVAERETDGLLIKAFDSQLKGKEEYARQCVHQALLLQYCRSLGRDGVGLFFKRITTPHHQAQKVFTDDVNSTYARIRTRATEIAKERAAEANSNGGTAEGGVEQIQLHAVDPNTTININVPEPGSSDASEQHARQIFETFPPGLQRALESGSLDEVNKCLGKMSVDEAEEVVGQLGEGGMLSLEEQIIDATTAEGQAALKEIEESQAHGKGKEIGGDAEVVPQLSEDPE